MRSWVLDRLELAGFDFHGDALVEVGDAQDQACFAGSAEDGAFETLEGTVLHGDSLALLQTAFQSQGDSPVRFTSWSRAT